MEKPKKSLIVTAGVSDADDACLADVVEKVGNIFVGGRIDKTGWDAESEEKFQTSVRQRLEQGDIEHVAALFHREGHEVIAMSAIAFLAGQFPNVDLDIVQLQGGWAGHKNHPYYVSKVAPMKRIR